MKEDTGTLEGRELLEKTRNARERESACSAAPVPSATTGSGNQGPA